MLTFDIKNTELIIDDIYKDIKRCRICGAYSDQLGYLYRCLKDKFCSSHWDQKKLREDFIFLFKKRSFHKNKKLINEAVTLILHNSKVKPAKSKSVYVLRLSDRYSDNNSNIFKPSCYVGMTGLPVEERMLNHIRGYKTGRVNTKKFTRSMIYFETGFTDDEAKIREKNLRDEMEDQGWNAKGGH